MKRLIFVVLGMSFGFLMSRAGATTFDYYAQLFLFQDLQLMWVITAAVFTGMMGIKIFRSLNATSMMDGVRINFDMKPMKKGLVFGALLFGIGWGMSGTCPGAAPAMLGEGKLIVLPALLGIVVGTYVYGLFISRKQMAEEKANAEPSI